MNPCEIDFLMCFYYSRNKRKRKDVKSPNLRDSFLYQNTEYMRSFSYIQENWWRVRQNPASNTAPHVSLWQHRTKSVWRLCTPSACKFSVIFHKNAREYIKYSLRFLFHLTKNLTTHLPHNLCAVLPQGKQKRGQAVLPSFQNRIISGIGYSTTPFCSSSARAVSTESTPTAFFTGANSLLRSTSNARQLSCMCTISSTSVSNL